MIKMTILLGLKIPVNVFTAFAVYLWFSLRNDEFWTPVGDQQPGSGTLSGLVGGLWNYNYIHIPLVYLLTATHPVGILLLPLFVYKV